MSEISKIYTNGNLRKANSGLDFRGNATIWESSNALVVHLLSPDMFYVDSPPYHVIGDGVTDDTANIQEVIDAAVAANAKTVFFGPKQYAIGGSLEIGATPASATSGLILMGSRRNVQPSTCTFRKIGGDTREILHIGYAHSCSFLDLSFDGNGIADYCIKLTSDVTHFQNEHHRFIGCMFCNANVYNVLLGENDGVVDDGDVTMIRFEECFFRWSDAGIATTAHVRQRSINSLNNAFTSCQFYGSDFGGLGGHPSYALSIESGTVHARSCIGCVLGIADIYLDDNGLDPPGTGYFYAWESQSIQLLATNGAVGTPMNRNCSFIDCAHNDIIPSTIGRGVDHPNSMVWGLNGVLLIENSYFATNNDIDTIHHSGGAINISQNHTTHVNLLVRSEGVTFNDAVYGLFSGSYECVTGWWRDGSSGTRESGAYFSYGGRFKPIKLNEGYQIAFLVDALMPLGNDQTLGIATITVNDYTGGAGYWAVLGVTGISHGVSILFQDPAAKFTTTFNNAGTINVYWDAVASEFQIQNKFVVNVTMTIELSGVGQH